MMGDAAANATKLVKPVLIFMFEKAFDAEEDGDDRERWGCSMDRIRRGDGDAGVIDGDGCEEEKKGIDYLSV